MDNRKERPQERWDRKNEYITMGVKAYRKEVNEFKNACAKTRVTVSGQVRKMMKDYVDEVSENGQTH